MKINAAWQTMNLDNKCSGSFICWDRISICKDTIHSEHWKMMRGELREDIFVCKKASGRALIQVEQGIVIEEGKI